MNKIRFGDVLIDVNDIDRIVSVRGDITIKLKSDKNVRMEISKLHSHIHHHTKGQDLAMTHPSLRHNHEHAIGVHHLGKEWPDDEAKETPPEHSWKCSVCKEPLAINEPGGRVTMLAAMTALGKHSGCRVICPQCGAEDRWGWAAMFPNA